jgi:hypothetical protein
LISREVPRVAIRKAAELMRRIVGVRGIVPCRNSDLERK